ncbi:SRPBCC family protein [Haloechinothrix sp. LS1_15]|uniref:type II toxin-antitoxin system Rv0910 family toxin n=1 Tax=Haloechinothrix sp. LS1_15 TaxID=2652248 RepID=UPI0029474FAA|nr:SRPBCC family protein [Haloechinothrix sp. LS1_15]MDV6011952.1 SRPBCC family protein [Haloechinothrix sp. LS1_15]
MGSVTSEVTIPALPETVWQVFANPANFERWLTIHSKWKGEVPDGFTQGSQITQVVSMLGMPNTITWTVEEYDEPKIAKISGTGMAGVRVSITLSAAPSEDGGTLATLDAEFSGQMIVGALGKAVEKDAQKQLDESMANFAALVS